LLVQGLFLFRAGTLGPRWPDRFPVLLPVRRAVTGRVRGVLADQTIEGRQVGQGIFAVIVRMRYTFIDSWHRVVSVHCVAEHCSTTRGGGGDVPAHLGFPPRLWVPPATGRFRSPAFLLVKLSAGHRFFDGLPAPVMSATTEG